MTKALIAYLKRMTFGRRRILRTSCSADAVPPFCFLAAGRSLEESARMAAKALGQTHATDVVVLAWKLRAAAEERR